MSYNTGARIVTNGLVLYLDAANTKSYPGTGTVWYDLSVRKNHANLVNGASFDAATGRGSINVDGSNDYISTTGSLGIINNAARTVILSVYYVSSGAQWGNIFTYGTGDCTGKMYGLGGHGSGVAIWGGCRDYITGMFPVSNAWNFMCLKYDGTSVFFNMNFRNFYSTSVAYLTVDSKFFLGGETVNNGSTFRGYLNGKYGITQVYDRCLSDSEVLQNYNSIKRRYSLT